MALNAGGGFGLGFVLEAKDAMSGILDRANDAVARIHDRIVKLGADSDAALEKVADLGKAVFDAGRGFLEGAFKLAEGAGPLEANMHEIQYWTNATEKQMGDMNDAVFSAQNALMGFTAADTAKVLRDWSRETGNMEEALMRLEPALLLAGITGRSAEAGVGKLNSLMDVFNQESEDAGESVDRIAVAAKMFHEEASDVADALGRTARGAQMVGATMTDSAIAVGILHDSGQSLGEVAMAVNMAFMRLGDSKVATALEKIAPGAKDAQGHLKPLGEILGLIADNTNKLSLEEQQDALRKAFGARSAGQLLRGIKDLNKGIEDGNGHLLKGSAAVKFYYEQMANSEGAARKMRDALLDTFEGQNTVLKAAIESLKTGLGAPLAAAFKPIVGAVAGVLAKVVEFFAKVDPEAKKFLAQVVLLGGALVSVLGGALVFLGGPATVAIFALIAAGAALYEAYQRNLGGFADWVHETVDGAVLAFQALASLFSKGGMSLELFDELEEHPGLKNFVLNIYVWVNRIEETWNGLIAGFEEGVARARPTFEAMEKALRGAAEAFGFLGDEVDTVANTGKLDAAGKAGHRFGSALAEAAEWVAGALTVAGKIADGFASSFGGILDAGAEFGPIWAEVKDLVMSVAAELGLLDDATGSSSDGWRMFGSAVATILGGLLSVVRPIISGIVTVIKGVVTALSGVVDLVGGIIDGDWSRIWHGFRKIVAGAVTAVLGLIGPVAETVGKLIDGVASLIGSKTNVAGMMKADVDSAKDSLSSWAEYGGGTHAVARAGGTPAEPVREPSAAPTAPTAAEVTTPSEGYGPLQAYVDAAAQKAAAAQKPITVQSTNIWTCDGKKLAEIVTEYQAQDASRSGVPTANPI